MNAFKKIAKYMTIESVQVIIRFLSNNDDKTGFDDIEYDLGEEVEINGHTNGKMFDDLNNDVEMSDS